MNCVSCVGSSRGSRSFSWRELRHPPVTNRGTHHRRLCCPGSHELAAAACSWFNPVSAIHAHQPLAPPKRVQAVARETAVAHEEPARPSRLLVNFPFEDIQIGRAGGGVLPFGLPINTSRCEAQSCRQSAHLSDEMRCGQRVHTHRRAPSKSVQSRNPVVAASR